MADLSAAIKQIVDQLEASLQQDFQERPAWMDRFVEDFYQWRLMVQETIEQIEATWSKRYELGLEGLASQLSRLESFAQDSQDSFAQLTQTVKARRGPRASRGRFLREQKR